MIRKRAFYPRQAAEGLTKPKNTTFLYEVQNSQKGIPGRLLVQLIATL